MRDAKRGVARIKIIVAVLALAALAAGGYGYMKKHMQSELDITTLERCKAEQGDMVVSLLQNGEVDAKRNLIVTNEMRRSSTILSIVDDGATVKKGDLLVELDTEQLQDDLLREQSTVSSQEAALSQAETGLEIADLKFQTDKASAELRVLLANLDLQKYEEAEYKQDLTRAEQAITLAREELSRAKDKLEWSEKLVAKGYTTRQEYEANKFEVTRKELEQKNKEEDLGILKEYTHTTMLARKQNDLREAESALSCLTKSYESGRARDLANLASRKMQLEMARLQLKSVEQELNNSKIYAESDGVTFYPPVDRHRSDRAIEKGASVYPSQPILRYPDVSEWLIRTWVPESVIDSVHVGQKALATIDAIPGAIIEAKVSKISVVPDRSRWYDSTAKVYTVDLDIATSTTTTLKPGMSAKVEIVTDELRNVLKVPIQSITSRDGAQYVYVVEGKTAIPKQVMVGKNNETHVEIKTGLQEAQELLLFAPVDTSTKSNSEERPLGKQKTKQQGEEESAKEDRSREERSGEGLLPGEGKEKTRTSPGPGASEGMDGQEKRPGKSKRNMSGSGGRNSGEPGASEEGSTPREPKRREGAKQVEGGDRGARDPGSAEGRGEERAPKQGGGGGRGR